jgi:NADPH:quinone reductase-like Zn-dependent oxidoreductase
VNEVVSELDVVFDPVGQAVRDWLPVIKPGGTLLPFESDDFPALQGAAAKRGITVKMVLVEPDGHALETLAALVSEGRLRVHVDATLPLASAAKAHELSEQGRTKGKIVLTI